MAMEEEKLVSHKKCINENLEKADLEALMTEIAKRQTAQSSSPDASSSGAETQNAS